MIGRRGFISILGGGVVLAAGAGGWAATRDPAAARAAWQTAGGEHDDPRMRWLS